MQINYSLNQLSEVAQKIIESSKSNVLLFKGEMGAGKTTLIKEICHQLGVIDKVSSPTFSLVNEYQTDAGEKVFHFDFYRIEKKTEALDMGFEEYVESGCKCLIEWPEKVENLVPLESSLISIIQNKGEDRTLIFQNSTINGITI